MTIASEKSWDGVNDQGAAKRKAGERSGLGADAADGLSPSAGCGPPSRQRGAGRRSNGAAHSVALPKLSFPQIRLLMFFLILIARED